MMTSKERVFHALKRDQLPDRVPLQFDLSRTLIEHFSKAYGIEPSYSQSYYEDLTYRASANELRTKMGSDCVVVGTGLAGGKGFELDENGEGYNEFGMKMRQGPLYMDVIEHPLEGMEEPEEAEALALPDPHDPTRYTCAEADIARFKDEYFVIGDVEVTIFAMARQMLGMEKCLMDILTEEEYIQPLMKKFTDWSLGVALELADRGVDAIWFGDDFGSQTNLLMSLETWQDTFREHYTRLISELRAKHPDIMVLFHCDGAVAPLLPEFISMGVDVFNPVQPNVPGHEPQDLQDAFGENLSFFGAIDQQDLLPKGTPEEIEADVKAKIDVLGKGGGYMVAPAHILQADTPPENVEAFIAAVKKHGKY